MPSHSTPINSNAIHCHLFHLNSPNGAFWHHLGFFSHHSPLSTSLCAFSFNSHQLHCHPPPPLPSQQPKQCLLASFGLLFTNPAPPCSHSTTIAFVHQSSPPMLSLNPHQLPLPSQQPKQCLLASFGLSSCHSPLSTPHCFCSPIWPPHAFSLNSHQLHRHPPLPFGIIWAFIQ